MTLQVADQVAPLPLLRATPSHHCYSASQVPVLLPLLADVHAILSSAGWLLQASSSVVCRILRI